MSTLTPTFSAGTLWYLPKPEVTSIFTTKILGSFPYNPSSRYNNTDFWHLMEVPDRRSLCSNDPTGRIPRDNQPHTRSDESTVARHTSLASNWLEARRMWQMKLSQPHDSADATAPTGYCEAAARLLDRVRIPDTKRADIYPRKNCRGQNLIRRDPPKGQSCLGSV